MARLGWNSERDLRDSAWYAKIMADGCAQCMEAVGEVSKRRPVSGEFLTLADPVTDSRKWLKASSAAVITGSADGRVVSRQCAGWLSAGWVLWPYWARAAGVYRGRTARCRPAGVHR